jgi:hypothetical protein
MRIFTVVALLLIMICLQACSGSDSILSVDGVPVSEDRKNPENLIRTRNSKHSHEIVYEKSDGSRYTVQKTAESSSSSVN